MFHVILLGFLPEEYSHVHYTDIIFVYSQYCYGNCNKRLSHFLSLRNSFHIDICPTFPFRDCTRLN